MHAYCFFFREKETERGCVSARKNQSSISNGDVEHDLAHSVKSQPFLSDPIHQQNDRCPCDKVKFSHQYVSMCVFVCADVRVLNRERWHMTINRIYINIYITIQHQHHIYLTQLI